MQIAWPRASRGRRAAGVPGLGAVRGLLLAALACVDWCGGEAVDESPVVSLRSDAFEFATGAALAERSQARKVAAFGRARRALSKAAASETFSEQAQTEARTTGLELESMAGMVASQADKAAASGKRAVGVLADMQASKEAMVGEARALATEQTQQMLLGHFRQLDGWRRQVLADPYSDATRDGAQAGEVYTKAMGQLRGRIQTYQTQARDLVSRSGRALRLAKAAEADAAVRVARQDRVGGGQDIAVARAARRQAGQLYRDAEALQASAGSMNEMVGEYSTARQAAAVRAEYDANPQALPPLPDDPDLSYVAPAF